MDEDLFDEVHGSRKRDLRLARGRDCQSPRDNVTLAFNEPGQQVLEAVHLDDLDTQPEVGTESFGDIAVEP